MHIEIEPSMVDWPGAIGYLTSAPVQYIIYPWVEGRHHIAWYYVIFRSPCPSTQIPQPKISQCSRHWSNIDSKLERYEVRTREEELAYSLLPCVPLSSRTPLKTCVLLHSSACYAGYHKTNKSKLIRMRWLPIVSLCSPIWLNVFPELLL